MKRLMVFLYLVPNGSSGLKLICNCIRTCLYLYVVLLLVSSDCVFGLVDVLTTALA